MADAPPPSPKRPQFGPKAVAESGASPQQASLPPGILSSERHGVVLANRKQIITHCNDTFVRLTGYTFDDVIGRNCRFLQGKNTSKDTVDTIRKAIREGKGCQVQILNYHKNGTPFWNQLSIQPLCDTAGNITQFVGIQIARPAYNMVPRFCAILPWSSQGGRKTAPALIEASESAEKLNCDDKKTGKKRRPPGETESTGDRKRLPRLRRHDMSYVAETLLPTRHGQYRVRAYKDNTTSQEIICIISGKVRGSSGLHVRCHDQCFTSEVLGSLKCDCRDQLEYAMKHIRERGKGGGPGGMIIYLPQEGRGMGLANKIKAYRVQEHGYDTVDANLLLGFPDDSRTYGCVPGILSELGIKSIKLMTNNPRKMEHLRRLGIHVEGRVPVIVGSNTFSRNYLLTKASRQGHLLDGIDTAVENSGTERCPPVTGSCPPASDQSN